jgi:hypothetical protein
VPLLCFWFFRYFFFFCIAGKINRSLAIEEERGIERTIIGARGGSGGIAPSDRVPGPPRPAILTKETQQCGNE